MKILALSPTDPDSLAGNSVTLRRIQQALKARGHEFVIVYAGDETPPDLLLKILGEQAPDVVHYYHAWKTGRFLSLLKHRSSVITLSGTDLNQDYEDPVRRKAIDQAIDSARVVLTYNPSLAQRISKARLIPKGISLVHGPFNLRSTLGFSKREFIFLLAGGLRPVKDPFFAVKGLEPLLQSHPQLRLVLAGPVTDPQMHPELQRHLTERAWVRHLIVPSESMQAAFKDCDVVLNTSISEGLSNALIEAMGAGAPLLASDNAGNRDLLQSASCGLLYRDLADFQAKAALLLNDPSLRRSLGAAARAEVSKRFSTDREAEALVAAYTEALSLV